MRKKIVFECIVTTSRFTFILLFGTDLITEIKKNKILRLKWIYFSCLGGKTLKRVTKYDVRTMRTPMNALIIMQNIRIESTMDDDSIGSWLGNLHPHSVVAESRVAFISVQCDTLRWYFAWNRQRTHKHACSHPFFGAVSETARKKNGIFSEQNEKIHRISDEFFYSLYICTIFFNFFFCHSFSSSLFLHAYSLSLSLSLLFVCAIHVHIFIFVLHFRFWY